MDILEAIFSGDDNDGSGKTRIHKKSQSLFRMNSIDDRIFICNECDKAWQKPISGFPKKSFSYYEDFPTIGKKRRTCPKCSH